MDIIVKCPKCGTEMLLSDGMMAFSCVECGETLFYIKGQVITKSEARALLKKLIEKRKARLAEEARAREEEEAAASQMPYSEPYAEEPVEHEIKKPALKLEPSEYDPNPTLKPQFSDDESSLYEGKQYSATPKIAFSDEDYRDITAPIAPVMPPVTLDEAAVEEKSKKKSNKEEKTKSEKKHARHYIKSGAGFATFLYVFAALIYGAWIFYVGNIVEGELGKLLNNAFGEDIGAYITLGLTAYFIILIMFMWICASSSYMSLGCVRKKINTKAELIASAATILNIPNLPLMGVLASNRKKFKKYRRTDKGNKFNFAPGYIATVSIIEIVVIAANVHWLYADILAFLDAASADGILEVILNFQDYLVLEVTIIVTAIVAIISLSRLIKIMVRGKKMKETFTSPI